MTETTMLVLNTKKKYHHGVNAASSSAFSSDDSFDRFDESRSKRQKTKEFIVGKAFLHGHSIIHLQFWMITYSDKKSQGFISVTLADVPLSSGQSMEEGVQGYSIQNE
jgi:hypothetical protein